MRRSFLTCVALALGGAPASIAENQIWTQIDLARKPSEMSRLEFALTTELRYQPDGDLGTVELRPGVTYAATDTLSLSGGYQYASRRREGADQREHRLWQQAGYALFGAGPGLVSGRTRLEERWREGRGETGWRLRQQISYAQPVGDSGLFAGVSTEAFLVLNETDWGDATGIREVRSQASLLGEFDNGAGWEFGYLNQFQTPQGGEPADADHHVFLGVSADF